MNIYKKKKGLIKILLLINISKKDSENRIKAYQTVLRKKRKERLFRSNSKRFTEV